MQVKWPLVLCFSAAAVGCKAHRETIRIPQPVNEEPEIKAPQQLPTQAKPTSASTPSQQSGVVPSTPVDLCATNPELYQMKDGKCVLIPLPSVEGELNISSGVIWKPDLSRCRSPAFDGGFKFCSGGVHASIPLPLPAQGAGKVRFSLGFNCKSFPAQNSLELSIGNETKLTLASLTVDTPIFLSEIVVEAGVAKSVRLDFAPNYSADYPASCQIYLIENKVI